MALTVNTKAVSNAHSLIAGGKIDHGTWDGQSAPRNADTCLAHDSDKAGTDEEYKYPVISGGHVSAKGVASAAGYAETEGASGIASVARRLSEEIHHKTHASIMASAAASYVLHLSDTGEGKPLPLSLEGLPSVNSEGQPIHYRRMKVGACRHWTHRGTGESFTITKERADEWSRNVKALAAAGVKPFIPGQHRDTFNAADNFGYVERMEREGDDVFAVVALHGDDALKVAARNGRSIYVVRDARDAHGNVYPGETLHHLALVPNPALPDLGGTVKIAASADTPARDVPVYELSATTPAPSRKGLRMKTELAQQVRAKLGLGAEVPDDQLVDKTAERALALSADHDQLSAQIAALTTERDAARNEAQQKAGELTTAQQEVLSLSADKKEPDALSLSLITKSFRTERSQVVESGTLSEAGMQEMDKLLLPNGKPSNIALSLSAGSYEPLYSRVCEIIRKFPGIRVNGKKPGTATSAVKLSAETQEEKPELARVNELRANQHLAPLAALPA